MKKRLFASLLAMLSQAQHDDYSQMSASELQEQTDMLTKQLMETKKAIELASMKLKLETDKYEDAVKVEEEASDHEEEIQLTSE